MANYTLSSQATHFVDLMRYLVGNIKKDSIETLAVGPHQMKLNDMAKPPLAEHPVHFTAPLSKAQGLTVSIEFGRTWPLEGWEEQVSGIPERLAPNFEV